MQRYRLVIIQHHILVPARHNKLVIHLWYWLSPYSTSSPLTAQVQFAIRVVPVGQKRKVEANPDKATDLKRTPVIKEVQHYGVDSPSKVLIFALAGKERQRLELRIEAATLTGDSRLLNGFSGIWANDLKPSTLKEIVAGGVRIYQD